MNLDDMTKEDMEISAHARQLAYSIGHMLDGKTRLVALNAITCAFVASMMSSYIDLDDVLDIVKDSYTALSKIKGNKDA